MSFFICILPEEDALGEACRPPGKKVEKKRENEVLMDYQKTRNYREKEKIEKRAQRKKGS